MDYGKSLREQFCKQLMYGFIVAAEVDFKRNVTDIIHDADFENAFHGLQHGLGFLSATEQSNVKLSVGHYMRA